MLGARKIRNVKDEQSLLREACIRGIHFCIPRTVRHGVWRTANILCCLLDRVPSQVSSSEGVTCDGWSGLSACLFLSHPLVVHTAQRSSFWIISIPGLALSHALKSPGSLHFLPYPWIFFLNVDHF